MYKIHKHKKKENKRFEDMPLAIIVLVLNIPWLSGEQNILKK